MPNDDHEISEFREENVRGYGKMSSSMNKEVTNLAGVISTITNLIGEQGTYWYRGHGDIEYKLSPSLFRPVNIEKKVYYEESLILEEMIRRFPKIRDEHTTTLELLTYAQHYGLPTRLLDWSENLLVALYFCCKEKHQKDGCLYILKTNEIQKYNNNQTNNITNLISSSFEIEIYRALLATCSDLHKHFLSNIPPKIRGIPYTELLDKTDVELILHFALDDVEPLEIDLGIKNIKAVDLYTYYAPLLNNRVIAQKGCFTVHGGKFINSKEIVKVSDMTALSRSGTLKKITIPHSAKSTILKELNICGINEHTLFPEIECQVDDIKRCSIPDKSMHAAIFFQD